MLKSLSIKNYALIQDLNIRFYEGLSVITGETGAGKSIMLGALNMISGKRAEQNAIIDKSKKCIIEAQFKIENYGLEDFFSEYDLDYEALTLVRREITPAGKSRAFINDTPVTLDVLRNLTDALIDIHSQHENLLINDNSFQLRIVDGIADNLDLLRAYKKSYKFWITKQTELSELLEKAKKASADKDYFQYQLNQLLLADLSDDNEQKCLEQELETLNNAEDIKIALSNIFSSISDDNGGVLNALTGARNIARKNNSYLPFFSELETRLDSVLIELKDISSEAELNQANIEHLPERISVVAERLNVLNELLHKHRLNSVGELIALRNELDKKLNNIAGYDDLIYEKQSLVDEALLQLKNRSKVLSDSRKKVFKQLESQTTDLLQDLGMPNGTFKIEHKISETFTLEGTDKINFLFSSNKNTPQALAKIASGGEKSRLMLALKSLISTQKSLPTIIFDEIDTGISGGIASKMAGLMARMGHLMQVISITHLPQIAAAGTCHYKVFKTDDELPQTKVIELDKNERLNEIASLLSSENITDTALKHAGELMDGVNI